MPKRPMRASVAGAACLFAIGLSACGSSSAAAKPAAHGSPSGSVIKIGYVTSLTGVASSTFQGGQYGAEARIDEQNAEGGVNGHKLELVVKDDQSSPAENQTASEDLVQSGGVFGVINFSSFTFQAAKYLQQAGVPVTGYGIDGPEWGQQPYTNMFDGNAPTYTPFGGVYYAYDNGLASFLKAHGVTKMAGLSYAASPSAQRSTNQLLDALKNVGISTCYNDASVPFGGVDFTAAALAMKSAGCNGVNAAFVDASDVALSQEVKQAGIQATQYYYEGYDQSVLSSPSAMSALDGDYFPTAINFISPNSAAKNMLNELVQHDPSFKQGDIPNLGVYGSWIATDLMIKGLELAGKNPTRQAFITNLRKVGSYNAGGLLPSSVTFQHFGTAQQLPETVCGYTVQLKGTKFVLADGGKLNCSQKEAS